MIQLQPQQHQLPGKEVDGGIEIDGLLYRFNKYGRLIPDMEVPSSHAGWMYDGVTVYVSGKLFKAHTRAEASEEYKRLSA